MIEVKRKARASVAKDPIDKKEMLAEVIKSKQRLKKNPDYPADALTPRLTEMFTIMVENYGKSSNWSGYSYLEEMKGEAIIGLCGKWHKFDETKWDNPFAYYTRIMFTCFVGQLKKEQKIQTVRDSILESRGEDPSLSRQMDNEEKLKKELDELEKINTASTDDDD